MLNISGNHNVLSSQKTNHSSFYKNVPYGACYAHKPRIYLKMLKADAIAVEEEEIEEFALEPENKMVILIIIMFIFIFEQKNIKFGPLGKKQK